MTPKWSANPSSTRFVTFPDKKRCFQSTEQFWLSKPPESPRHVRQLQHVVQNVAHLRIDPMRNPNKWHVPLGLIQNLKAITKKSWQWSQINHQSQFRELREPFPLLHLFCPPSDPCGWSWSERDKTPPGHNSAGALVDLCGTMDPTVSKPSHWRVRRISSAKQTSKCWQKNPAPFGDSSRTRGIPPNSANEPSPETSPPLPAVVPKASRCSGVRKRTPFRWQIKGRRLPSGGEEIQWYLSCGRCSWEKLLSTGAG